MNEAVAILGATGNLGYGMAVRLGRAGFSVVIGSRDEERAKAAAAKAGQAVPGADFRGEANPAAAAARRPTIVAVPFASQVATLKAVAKSWREGQVVLDATVPAWTRRRRRADAVDGSLERLRRSASAIRRAILCRRGVRSAHPQRGGPGASRHAH